jgi:hypothetical protein
VRTAKRLAALLVATALLAAACGGVEADPTTTTEPGTTTTAGDVTTTTAADPTTSTGAPSTTAAPPTTSGGEAGDVAGEAASLIEATERIRGLQFIDPPEITVLDPDALAERIREDVAAELDPDEIAVEQRFYELLGLLDGSVDLYGALIDLYAEQVIGFYDDDTGELVVSSEAGITPMTRMVMLHELVHALTDQHFGFGDDFEELLDAGRYHEGRALQSLIEGDATYFQIVYLQEMSPADQLAVATEALGADTAVIDSLPAWLSADLSFPYDTGFSFVSRLVADGGIAAVDQAYRLVPETVEQVIHPEKYYSLEPARQVTLDAAALTGYEVAEEDAFGEWNLQLYLEELLGGGPAAIASAGWGGDAYRLLASDTEVAFAYRYQGDTPRDAEELADALTDAVIEGMAVGNGQVDQASGSTAFSGGDYAYVQHVGSDVLFVAASDPTAGAALVESLRLPPDDD